MEKADWLKGGMQRPEWTQVDHSNLCVGWGTDHDGTKYWIVQNNWGRTGACKGSCSRNEAMMWEAWRVLLCVQILLYSRGMQVGICTLSTLININRMVKMTREEME